MDKQSKGTVRWTEWVQHWNTVKECRSCSQSSSQPELRKGEVIHWCCRNLLEKKKKREHSPGAKRSIPPNASVVEAGRIESVSYSGENHEQNNLLFFSPLTLGSGGVSRG